MSTKFLLRITGNGSSRSFELLPGDVSRVGRAVDSNILIADPNISRHQLTLHARADQVDVEVNPQSSNQLLRKGQAALALSLVPGEFFDLGPYRFELEATQELPAPAPSGLPPDPAGAIDTKLAAESRIAPRWSTVSNHQGEAQAAAAGESPLKKVLLSCATVVVVCLVGWEYIFSTPTGPTEEGPPPTQISELLASIQPPSCHSAEACLNMATESFKLGEKLRTSGARDLITLYRIAKQFHRAQMALNGRDAELPRLQDSYRQAKSELATAFSDVQFRFDRARAEGGLERQIAALQEILALCQEDRLPICTDRERTYQQLREQLLMR